MTEKPDEEILLEAINIANKVKKNIANEILKDFPKEKNPISVFMAGSPGAGKTESSIRLTEEFDSKNKILRIDPDDYRKYFPEYTGNNSHLFQKAVTIIASKIHDYAIENNYSFIFDSTFSNLDKARENILRSIKRNRPIQIYYIYQDPKQAWEFVKRREEKEGRKITKSDFIEKYLMARNVVNEVKKEFNNDIQVDLIIKNIDGSDQLYKENIDVIDNYIEEKYNMDTLNNLLSD
ncbi:MAG: hypothetical protein RLY43_43 [Bacteroidota bacterium]|jgi:adenylate kinase family enzyme